MLTRSADIDELETAAAAEISADPAAVLWVSIRSEQAYEVVMGPRLSFAVPQTYKLLLYFAAQSRILRFSLLPPREVRCAPKVPVDMESA